MTARRTAAAPRPLRAGLTLAELMIALIIIAIIMGLALPSVLHSLQNRRVYDAALAVAQVFKTQRYRAQNLNLAMGVRVTTEGQVLTYRSTNNTCNNIASATPTVAVDLAVSHTDAAVRDSDFLDTVICIRPDGSVINPADGQPFANGPVRILVGRADDVGPAHQIVVPFNGIARLD